MSSNHACLLWAPKITAVLSHMLTQTLAWNEDEETISCYSPPGETLTGAQGFMTTLAQNDPDSSEYPLLHSVNKKSNRLSSVSVWHRPWYHDPDRIRAERGAKPQRCWIRTMCVDCLTVLSWLSSRKRCSQHFFSAEPISRHRFDFPQQLDEIQHLPFTSGSVSADDDVYNSCSDTFYLFTELMTLEQ